MSLLGLFRKLDRQCWFLCYECMRRTGREGNPDAMQAIFRYDGPSVEINGRAYVKCLRCDSINTISFRQLKEGGEEAQLWGLERIAKAHPRSVFEVKHSA